MIICFHQGLYPIVDITTKEIVDVCASLDEAKELYPSATIQLD